MKKVLFFLLLTIVYSSNNPSAAQCIISDLKVRLSNVNTSNCEVIFDLSWTQEVNNGNKFAYVHMWTQPGYHTPAASWINMYNGTNAYPKAADLVNALATIVIENNSGDTPLIGSVYHPDPVYQLPQLSGLSVVKAHLNNTLIEGMTIKNIHLTLPSCTGAATINFDIWASQSANGKNVHCAVQNAALVINEVKPLGALICILPRQYQVFIQNTGPVLDNITYKVYVDYPPIAVINDTDTLVFTSNPLSLAANSTYTSAMMDYLPYSNQVPSANMPLIVEVTVPNRPNSNIATIENGCGALPVKLLSFTAQQGKDNIVLTWQTATEQNNKGFEVQRMLPGEDYKAIAFVPSKAADGNSDVLLKYNYNDIDNLKTAGQLYYRLKQINYDGSSSYSDIRLVKNKPGTIEVLIYPNPATTTANIILPAGIGMVDVLLLNSSGKQVQQWSGVINTLQLNNLNCGMYLLRIFVKETGVTQVNKIVIL